MKRRVVAAILASVLALAGVVMIALYVRGADARAVASLNPTSVLVVTKEIPRGQAATLGSNVEARQLPQSAVAPGVVSSLDQLKGLVADTTLHPGEQIFPDRFIQPQALTDDEVVVPKELVQLTIKLAPERVLGGQLKPGDKVGVDLSWSGNSVSYTHPYLHQVLVTRVANAQATGDDQDKQPADTQLVTLAVLAREGDRIIWAAEHGTIWLTLEREESDTSGGTTITWGDPDGVAPTTAPTPEAQA